MSQQINLLPPAPRGPALSAQRALLATGLWLLVVAWQGLQVISQADAAHQSAARSARELQQQGLLLQALKKKLGEATTTGNIATQIAALEPQTRVSKDLLERLRSGELGSLEGYGAQLTELAMLPSQGVWITQAVITDAGRKLRIEGRALRKESVLPYAHAVNAAMKKYGAQLEHIEVSPVRSGTDTSNAAVPVSSFKLY